MWTPASEEDLEVALSSGDLKESHTHELKRELGSTPGERAETARDLASLAIDGGVLIIGVEENKEQRTFSLSPFPLEGQLEALEQIAALRIDPRIAIYPTEVPSVADKRAGYIVVIVPPSANAPHMVQGVYYGRGERTRERLSDAQVVRYQRARSSDGERAESALVELVAADPVPSADTRNGHLYLVAVPVSAPARIAEDLAWSSDQVREVAKGVEGRLSARLHEPYPAPANLQWPVRREHGFAWTSVSPRSSDWAFDEDGAMEFEIRDDGSIRVFVGRLTDMWEKRRGEEELSLIDLLLVANAYRILFWAAELGRRVGYAGAWDIGIAGNGMRGASSLAAEDRPMHRLGLAKVTYPADTFRELARATAWEIENHPGGVVDRLIGRVLRAISTTDEIRDLAR